MRNFDDVKKSLMDDVEDTMRLSYNHGYDDGCRDSDASSAVLKIMYEKGLQDAWECAKKIVHFRSKEDRMDFYRFMNIASYIDMFEKYSVSEAIEKIEK